SEVAKLPEMSSRRKQRFPRGEDEDCEREIDRSSRRARSRSPHRSPHRPIPVRASTTRSPVRWTRQDQLLYGGATRETRVSRCDHRGEKTRHRDGTRDSTVGMGRSSGSHRRPEVMQNRVSDRFGGRHIHNRGHGQGRERFDRDRGYRSPHRPPTRRATLPAQLHRRPPSTTNTRNLMGSIELPQFDARPSHLMSRSHSTFLPSFTPFPPSSNHSFILIQTPSLFQFPI
ncbi:hypothetical protein PFISCL1PPCAC_23300, partial [Pristionchus fissidentatus]